MKYTLEERLENGEDLVVRRTRKKSDVWDALLVEEMPMIGGICSARTVIGTGLTTENGSIRVSIKKGISIQGSVELRPKICGS